MSTQFETGFGNGDLIVPDHVKQFASPINDLESGAALYRVATNDSGVYQVDFRSSANPDGHAISSLQAGQMIVFKASHSSPPTAELKVLKDGGSGSETHPLFLGDTQADVDDILENQMVVVVFNNTTTPRFDVVGVSSSSGGVGAAELSELSDAEITSPATGEVLRFDGTNFVNAVLEMDDVDGLTAAIASAGGAEELNELSDVELTSPTTGEVLRFDGADFVNAVLEMDDVDGLTAAIASAGGSTTGHIAEIQGLTLTEGDILTTNSSGEIIKLAPGSNGQVLKISSGVPAWGESVGGGGGGDWLTTGLVAHGSRYTEITSTSDDLRSSPFTPVIGRQYLIRWIPNFTSSVSQINRATAITNGQAHYCRAEETGDSTPHDIGFSCSWANGYVMNVNSLCKPFEFVWTATTDEEVEIVLGQPSLDYGEFTGTLFVYEVREDALCLGWGEYGSGYTCVSDASNSAYQIQNLTYLSLELDSSKKYAIIANWWGGSYIKMTLKLGSTYYALPQNSETWATPAGTANTYSDGIFMNMASVHKGEFVRVFSPPSTDTFGFSLSWYAMLRGCYWLIELP